MAVFSCPLKIIKYSKEDKVTRDEIQPWIEISYLITKDKEATQ